MKILVAPNSLKGSLDAFAAARAIAEGLLRGLPRAETVEVPIADGGDFTAAILVASLGGAMVDAPATDPLGHVRRFAFGALADGDTAVVEAASASGLTLVDADHRDPMSATSYGTGELISAALDRGLRRILIGLGGTATVDAGAGLVTALGARLLDAQGAPIERGGRGLSALASIDLSGLDPRLAEAEILALCDVDCELLGERGAAPMFAPQKGATPAMVSLLAANLARFAEVVQRDLGVQVGTLARGGAAGGMAAGIAALLKGRLLSGTDVILERLRIDEQLAGCDVVVTAEGKLDRQTLASKGPAGVARAARKRGRPVIMLTGGVDDDLSPEELALFDAVISICPRPISLAEAMLRAPELVTRAAEQVGRLLGVGVAVGYTRIE
jgi:glycerate kinase